MMGSLPTNPVPTRRSYDENWIRTWGFLLETSGLPL